MFPCNFLFSAYFYPHYIIMVKTYIHVHVVHRTVMNNPCHLISFFLMQVAHQMSRAAKQLVVRQLDGVTVETNDTQEPPARATGNGSGIM